MTGAQETAAKAAPGQASSKVTFAIKEDYLGLHVTGKAPAGTQELEWRVAHPGQAEPQWSKAGAPAQDGGFAFDAALTAWPWERIELRALRDGSVLAEAARQPAQRKFAMLTPERVAALPQPEREAWTRYLESSDEKARHERAVLAGECRKLSLAASLPAPSNSAEFELGSDKDEDWIRSGATQRLADAVLSFQTPSGGWSKAVDYSAGPRQPGMQWTIDAGNPWHYCGTLDNRSTTEQIKFLAWVHHLTGREDAKAGSQRGIEWLLAAQYPNGGWPQNYPVEPGYHEAITLNDDAMLHALEVLQRVRDGEEYFAWVERAVRERAGAAFARGLECLRACQVRVDGKPTVWCAQHDPLSLEPVAARLKEPPSLSGSESANLLKFLMRDGPLDAATIGMIEAGLEWLSAHRITGLRKVKNDAGKTDYIADHASDEIYWARFYDVQTAEPMFAGAQDGIVYKTFHEMAQHNKVGYDYFTTKPADVTGKEVERWKKRIEKEGGR